MFSVCHPEITFERTAQRSDVTAFIVLSNAGRQCCSARALTVADTMFCRATYLEPSHYAYVGRVLQSQCLSPSQLRPGACRGHHSQDVGTDNAGPGYSSSEWSVVVLKLAITVGGTARYITCP